MIFNVTIITKSDDGEDPDYDEMFAALRDEIFKLGIELEDGSHHTVTMFLEAD